MSKTPEPTPSAGAARAALAIAATAQSKDGSFYVQLEPKTWAEIIDRETGVDVSGIEGAVCREIAERQTKGIAKYGQQLADNPAPLSERLQHAKEESMDQTCYLEWARVEAVRLEAMAAKLAEAFQSYIEASEFYMKGMMGDEDQELFDARAALAAWKEGR